MAHISKGASARLWGVGSLATNQPGSFKVQEVSNQALCFCGPLVEAPCRAGRYATKVAAGLPGMIYGHLMP